MSDEKKIKEDRVKLVQARKYATGQIYRRTFPHGGHSDAVIGAGSIDMNGRQLWEYKEYGKALRWLEEGGLDLQEFDLVFDPTAPRTRGRSK